MNTMNFVGGKNRTSIAASHAATCRWILTLVVAVLTGNSSTAQQKRGITASDCVTVRNLQFDDATWRSTIKISPNAMRVAYPIEVPNLKNNQNEVELYVRDLDADDGRAPKPLLIGKISAVRWRPDSRYLTALERRNGRNVIVQVNSVSGDLRTLFETNEDIAEYSLDEAGDTLVYSVNVPSDVKFTPTPQQSANGYRIAFDVPASTSWASERLFLTRSTGSGWAPPEPIIIKSPLDSEELVTLVHGNSSDLRPTFSPDGKKLLITYMDFSSSMPDEWRNSAAMRHRNTAGIIQAFRLLVVYDTETKETTVPLKTPWVYSTPLWSPDAKSFAVVAQAPVGSDLEKEDVNTDQLGESREARLFKVETSGPDAEQISPHLANPEEGPLLWAADGDVFVRVSSLREVSHYRRASGAWRRVSSFQIPVEAGPQVATDGRRLIVEFSDKTTPPQLLLFDQSERPPVVLAAPNQQFEELTVAPVREVHWTTATGFEATGLLVLPPDYAPGTRYPLVIQTRSFATGFNCSIGHFPSFAPQPIANAGMIYLGLSPGAGHQRRNFPKGYPGFQGVGGIAEAAFAMDLWDSAVRALDERGLVDKNRVGIIGFSRSGWYTEFILAHSTFKYRAATVADNVQYSFGEYWLSHDEGTLKTYDLTYGGPPYGASLKNWLDFSVSFNLDRLQTPLLMEQMGYGLPYDNPDAPPLILARSFEVFSGLNRLHKPVELYYYPNEGHEPEHPQARLATMQRNVDWYRFWLKGEEDPDPAKVEQYKRWHELRNQQESKAKTSVGPN